MNDDPLQRSVPLLTVAFGARCPRCGQGRLFDGYLAVKTACSVCQLGLAGHDSGDGPAFFVMMPLCILVAVAALLTDLRYAPPMWVHMALWPAIIIAVVAMTLRPVKALMIGLQYRHRDVERTDDSGQQ